MRQENPITQTVGSNIAKARKHKGLTQKQLGDRVGVSETAVRYWESARREISHDSLIAVGDELSRPWLWFYQNSADVPERTKTSVRPKDHLAFAKELPPRWVLTDFRVTDEEVRIYNLIKMKDENGKSLSEKEVEFLEAIRKKILDDDGLSFCPPAHILELVEEKTVISAALLARAAYLEEQQRKAG